MKSNNYIFDAIVDDIHCIDDECVIFDIINNIDLPTKHCFISNKLLEKKLIAIKKGVQLRISAAMIFEKNYLKVIDCKDLNFSIIKKIRIMYNIFDKRRKKNRCRKLFFNIKPFAMYLNRTFPIVTSDKNGIKTILFKGIEYQFVYVNDADGIKIVSLLSEEKNFTSYTNLEKCRKWFSSPRKKHVLVKCRFRKIYKAFEKHEYKKRIFDEHLELCRDKIGDVQVKGVCLDGLVSNLKKNDGEVEFDLYTSKSTYKCVLLSSVYSNKFNGIGKGRKHLVGGFLVDRIIYVIFLHEATKTEENMKGLKKHLRLAYARRIKELERKLNDGIHFGEK